MSDPLDMAGLGNRNATEAERFVSEMAAIDRAYATGQLDRWLKEKLASEHRRTGIAASQ